MTLTARPRYVDRRDDGFTLIELLIVMIIIGILAAIAIPLFLTQQKKSYDTRAKSEMHTAILTFLSDYTGTGTFTNDAAVLRGMEPSVAWKSSYGSSDNNPAIDTIVFENGQVSSGTTTVVAVLRSKSDKCFYVRIIGSTSTPKPPGVTYLSEAGPCVDPWDKTDVIVNGSW